jgi:hypothetical protein
MQSQDRSVSVEGLSQVDNDLQQLIRAVNGLTTTLQKLLGSVTIIGPTGPSGGPTGPTGPTGP